MLQLFSGEIPTADELNQLLGVGEMVVNITSTSNSSTWNSATKVLTNLTATWTAIDAAVYHATLHSGVQAGASAVTPALGIVIKAGGAAGIADTIYGAQPHRMDTATGIYSMQVDAYFTAASSGTHGIAVVGWNPGGDTSATKLYGDAAFSINRLTVKRVG